MYLMDRDEDWLKIGMLFNDYYFFHLVEAGNEVMRSFVVFFVFFWGGEGGIKAFYTETRPPPSISSSKCLSASLLSRSLSSPSLTSSLVSPALSSLEP